MSPEKFLLRYAKKYWYLFLVGTVLSLILTVMEILPPRLMKTAIDKFLVESTLSSFERLNGIVITAFIILGIRVLSFLVGFASSYVTGYAGSRIVLLMRKDVFSHVISLPYSFFTGIPSGVVTTRIVNDTQNIQEFFSSVVTSVIMDVLLLGAVVVSLVQLSRELFGHVYYLLPLIVISILLFRYFDRRAYRKVRTNLARLNAFLAEHIAGINVTKILNLEKHKEREFSTVATEYYRSLMEQLYVFGVFRPLMDFLYFLGVSLVLWYGARYIANKTLGFGSLYAFVSYLDMFFRPLRDLSEKYDIIQNSMASSEKILNLLKEEPEVIGNPNGPNKISKGRVRFENVWFSYDGKNWVLKDINLDFQPGKLYAIVGETGGGKSTLMSLINGLYIPQKGNIFIDEIPLLEYNLKLVRKQIAAVPQDVLLFSGTILDNIRLFDESIPEERVLEALKRVHALDIIERLPGGVYYEIVERGTTLSAGERQLIALARAVLFDAKIFILDEATSNVDVITETKIQEALEELSKDRTVIMIAHRLSTVKDVDEIVVVHNGRIVEKGNHYELLEKRGFYYNLYKIQFENA
ncbi:ABC transporter ATP-binding protein [Thermotoga maritima MSB8]|uniref:ABC transporter ATP-binding protein n=1 Tax=Thermotoga maritima TaxID=2336 RepID=UPI00022D99D7|nr:ABC transporter ATP-binding protein [Thermotoga maritima]AGL48966.1 ABC transporter, ATP-binding protein [Thermotoga maritima MSB8]AKE25990.1 ABC transporter ATP-binding protein [Thermotoga maritima]AKE27852.1 ABC transporter ATP-binding protein [Thermotoga maritima MSB8]AKE29725.1 ABC transporter ATP-binding protein [Thermotoga maritima]